MIDGTDAIRLLYRPGGSVFQIVAIESSRSVNVALGEDAFKEFLRQAIIAWNARKAALAEREADLHAEEGSES